ncbi:MAG: hypothetical protein AUH29_17565 [Candidatus Rokubacteria bacterium 13_1_40CM_69_27]|nr:MAG: hypothetical protein AUH29_17565 [Candidatus Rokubacteria bacterium 13_1_40CM_69_27]
MFIERGPEPKAVGDDAQRHGSARATLDRARFFLRQAAICGIEDPVGFEHYINACIVFGRSVTFQLQKEFKHRAGFDNWYEPLQTEMKEDKLSLFFNAARTFIIHKEGSLRTQERVTRSRVIGILPVGWIELPEHDAAWYRRLRASGLRPYYRLKLKWFFFRERRRARHLPIEMVTVDLHFEDAGPLGATPALQLTKEYLNGMEAIVEEAELRFHLRTGTVSS